MTIIKVCGITEERDALEAVHLGVDAVGFVFSKKSPRAVSPREAARIGSKLPPFVARVGVFIDEPADAVADAVYAAGLTTLQFHGSETPDYCRRFTLSWYKTFRLGSGFDPERLSLYACSTCFLEVPESGSAMEAFQAARYGRIILGGALAPMDVGPAIEAVRPYAVDASHGVEFAPGKLDIDKLEAFVEAVRQADTRLRLFDRRD